MSHPLLFCHGTRSFLLPAAVFPDQRLELRAALLTVSYSAYQRPAQPCSGSLCDFIPHRQIPSTCGIFPACHLSPAVGFKASVRRRYTFLWLHFYFLGVFPHIWTHFRRGLSHRLTPPLLLGFPHPCPGAALLHLGPRGCGCPNPPPGSVPNPELHKNILQMLQKVRTLLHSSFLGEPWFPVVQAAGSCPAGFI